MEENGDVTENGTGWEEVDAVTVAEEGVEEDEEDEMKFRRD